MTAHETKSFLPALSQHATQAFAPLHREIDRVFADFGRNLGAFEVFSQIPKMDFSESKDAIELTVDLPGYKESDVSVTVDGEVLTVTGETKTETEEKTKTYHFTERQHGAFVRSVRLPHRVDADKLKAKLQNGVLKITAPKTGPDTSRKIEIQTAKA